MTAERQLSRRLQLEYSQREQDKHDGCARTLERIKRVQAAKKSRPNLPCEPGDRS